MKKMSSDSFRQYGEMEKFCEKEKRKKKIEKVIKKCFVCEKTENLSRCSLCQKIYYCGKEHQKQDWKRHQKNCRIYQELIAPNKEYQVVKDDLIFIKEKEKKLLQMNTQDLVVYLGVSYKYRKGKESYKVIPIEKNPDKMFSLVDGVKMKDGTFYVVRCSYCGKLPKKGE